MVDAARKASSATRANLSAQGTLRASSQGAVAGAAATPLAESALRLHSGREADPVDRADLRSRPARSPRAGLRVDGLRGVLTPRELALAFTRIARDLDIPHDFIDEGCHCRAHVAAFDLESQGFFSEKVFARPSRGDLRLASPKGPLGFTFAMFHVAPVVWVALPTGVERRVIDPALFDEPVSVDRWLGAMSVMSGETVSHRFYPRTMFHVSDLSSPAPKTFREKDLAHARAWNQEFRAAQTDMLKNGFYEHLRALERGET